MASIDPGAKFDDVWFLSFPLAFLLPSLFRDSDLERDRDLDREGERDPVPLRLSERLGDSLLFLRFLSIINVV